MEELTEEKRILIARLKAVQYENVGEQKSPSGLNRHSNLSQKTGIMSQATKMTDNDVEKDSMFPASSWNRGL